MGNVKVASVIIMVVAAIWVYLTFGTATISVTSEPSGALVIVDGQRQGSTPVERLEVDIGAHQIEIAHSYFVTHVERISFARGDHFARHIELETGAGTFEFLSNPKGAWIEVDGKRLPGTTPMVYALESGPHVIRMGQSERHVVEETHTINDGESKEVNFNLNIDPHGTLTIATEPRGAKIEILGAGLDYEPKMRIPIGEHSIRVSKRGYIAQEFRYKVRYGSNLESVRLKRQFADLHVVASPNNSELTVIYDDAGITHRKLYRESMRIPTGQVELRARAVGYRTQHKRIDLGSQGATVLFQLVNMQADVGSELSDKLASSGRGPVMVVLPPGDFQMGDPNGSYSEKPVRTVTITQPFAMSKYEVTVGEYAAFASATGRKLHTKLPVDVRERAVHYVSFEDAQAYADWLTRETQQKYRLPSEAEWEYAARAGTTSDYFFGDDSLELCNYANIADLSARERFREWDVTRCDDGLVRPGEGGRYQANPFGLYDIYGNVSEWVSDCGLSSYEDAPTDGSPTMQGLSCSSHGIRGGSWDSMAVEAKSAYRNTAANANDDRGIRLVREL